jgi:hypothetical protein
LLKAHSRPRETDQWAEVPAQDHRRDVPSTRSRKVLIPHNEAIYKLCNRIERCFNKLKHFRRFATRYDRRADYFLAFVHLAAICICSAECGFRPSRSNWRYQSLAPQTVAARYVRPLCSPGPPDPNPFIKACRAPANKAGFGRHGTAHQPEHCEEQRGKQDAGRSRNPWGTQRCTRHSSWLGGHDGARPIRSASGLALPSSCRCDRPSPCRSPMWAAARSCGSKPDRSMLESR